MTKPTRREFIVYATAAAAAMTTAAATCLPALTLGPGRAHIVGLGKAGGAFLDFVFPRLPPDFDRNIHRIDTEYRAGLLGRSFLGIDQPPFLPGDPIVFLVGLGARMGDAAPRLVKAMLEKGHPSVVVCSLPFAMEGKARRTRAETAAGSIKEAGGTLHVVDYQIVLQEEGSSDAAFGRVESLALEVVLSVGRGLPVPVTPAWSSYAFSGHRDIPLPRL